MSALIPSGNATGTGTMTLLAPPTNGTQTITLPDTTGTVATLNTPSFLTTIGVGGTSAANTGAGISFPATQSASSDANTLDDYEEGTWTPTFTFGSSAPSSVTYSTQSGRYTKTGRVVYIECYIRISAYSGGSGNVLVAGFPFTSASSPYAELFIGESAGFTVTGTYYGLFLEVNAGATNAILLKMAPNLASTSVVATEMGSATTVYLLFSGCYTTS